jgi:hypothetical protein
MELRAVIEALRNLPEDMHVWISADSAYVKRGITEWFPRWIARSWRNAKGDTISNLSQWQALLNQVELMRVVQWTWVKAHYGCLLNECAGTLATKGVRTETQSANTQYHHPINEDIDSNEYESAEGEPSPIPSNWKGHVVPEKDGVYTQKSDANVATFLSSTTSPETTPYQSGPFSAVPTDVPSDDTSEPESDVFPQPQDSEDDGKFKGVFPARIPILGQFSRRNRLGGPLLGKDWNRKRYPISLG